MTLLFYGTIRENKGLHHLLDCFEQLPSDWRIVIAGSIAEADYYEREVSPRIQRLMAAQRSVHLSIGFVPEESVAALFAAADLLVLPYFGFEAQSGVLLDAVAHRTPVVVTAAGAMADTVRASGIGVVAASHQPTALAAAIKEALTLDPGELESAWEAAAKQNSWSTAAHLTSEIYGRLGWFGSGVGRL